MGVHAPNGPTAKAFRGLGPSPYCISGPPPTPGGTIPVGNRSVAPQKEPAIHSRLHQAKKEGETRYYP